MCRKSGKDWSHYSANLIGIRHIREEDVKLQFIEFGGRLFAELMLVF